MALIMLIPSRGRPQAAAAAVRAASETATDPDTLIQVCVDDNDPELLAYMITLGGLDVRVRIGVPNRIGPLLNQAALEMVDEYTHIGFMGDDHRPRSEGWDVALQTDGVAYGNDLFQSQNLPTAVVMASSIVKELGYFCPPGAWHLFLDNAWKDIGDRYGLTYLDDVILEHMHPHAGKGEMDEGYEANNSGATWEHDQAVYEAWKETFNA